MHGCNLTFDSWKSSNQAHFANQTFWSRLQMLQQATYRGLPLDHLALLSSLLSYTQRLALRPFPALLDSLGIKFHALAVSSHSHTPFHQSGNETVHYYKCLAHFSRSNCDILFPTGLRTLLPSLVKVMFPCLYTAPHRLENYRCRFTKVRAVFCTPFLTYNFLAGSYLVSKLRRHLGVVVRLASN